MINRLISATIFFLPLYLLKIKIFFVPFNILEIIIWLVFVFWLKKKIEKNKIREIGEIGGAREILLPALLVLLGATLSTLLSENIIVSAGILKSWFLAPMAFGLMVYMEVRDEKNAKRLFGALFVSAAVVALIAIFYFVFGRMTFDGRLSAFYLSPNHLAMYLAPGFLIGLFFMKSSKAELSSGPTPLFQRGVKKTAVFCGLALISVALYLTYSYAAWIAVIIVTGIWWLAISGKRKKMLTYGLIFLLLIAILFFSQLGNEKFSNLLSLERSSLHSRLMIWRAALEIAKDHPIFGVGPGMFQKYYLDYQSRFSVQYLEWAVPQPHNIFLAFWLQTGILGLFGLLWLLVVFFRRTIKQAGVMFSCCGTHRPAASSNSPHCENTTPACFSLILAGLMFYILLHGLADTTYWKNDLAIMFWTIIAISAVLYRKQSQPVGQ